MLQSIHDNAKGWVAYLIVILISVPFALWGIQEYIGGGSKNIVAVVNGQDIEKQQVQNAVSQQRQRMMQMLGRMPPGFDEKSLRQSALDNIVDQTLLEQYAREKGYRASPKEVRELIDTIPQFQKEGAFDPQLYRQVLASQGRGAASFEEQLRASLSNDQFRNAIADIAFLPKSEMAFYQSLSQQKRDIEVYTVKLEDVTKDLQIGDDKVEAYYKEHPEQFQTDELVKVAYVELNEADINKSIEVTDELLQAYYEDNSDLYFENAKFKMSHIKVGISDKQDDAQAKAKADALYASISSGQKSFDDTVASIVASVAASQEDDTLFFESGETVGFLNKGTIDAAMEAAVFGAKKGETVKPVKTDSGYEIIKVLDVIEEHQKPFDQAKAQVEKQYRKKQSSDRYEDLLELLRTTSFENDGSLDPSSVAVSGEIKTTDFFSRSGGKEGITADRNVIEAAFKDEVLTQGINSSLIEVSGTQALVLRKDGHKKPEQKPIADVRDTIIKRLKSEEGRKLAKEKGDALLSAIKSAGNWNSLGEAANSVVKHVDVLRSDPKVPTFITSEAFLLVAPDAGKVTYTTLEQPNGDYTIVAVTAVKKGDSKVDEAAQDQFSSYIGNRIQAATLQAMRGQADIETFSERLNSE